MEFGLHFDDVTPFGEAAMLGFTFLWSGLILYFISSST